MMSVAGGGGPVSAVLRPSSPSDGSAVLGGGLNGAITHCVLLPFGPIGAPTSRCDGESMAHGWGTALLGQDPALA